MATQVCAQCGAEKDVDQFRKVTNQYTGVHPMSICKACYTANQQAQKRKWEEEAEARKTARKANNAPLSPAASRELDELLAQLMPKRQPLTEGNPTEVTDHAWIHAFCKQGEYPAATERNGKWLIFLSEASIDRYWQKIKTAVEQGLLGSQAKVSTRSSASMPPDVRRKKEERGDTRFVICVYTYDYEDREDVMRVRQVLRELGIQRPIRYKADAQTRAGSYGSDYRPIYVV